MAEEININILKQYVKKLSNLKPIMREVSEDMIDAVKENFEKEGRPPWEKLSQTTIRERARLGYWPGKILQRSGMLLRSIFKKYDESSATVGTNKEYAPLHQFGGSFVTKPFTQAVTKKGRFKSKKRAGKDKKKTDIRFMSSKTVTIPARPFLTIPDNELNQIKKKITGWLVNS